jgi:hypothetical protein
MPGAIEPSRRLDLTTRTAGLTRRTERTLSRMEEGVLIRISATQGEALVSASKLQELDFLGRQAALGEVANVKMRDAICAGDPVLMERVTFLLDIGLVGKGEIIADTVAKFRRI